MSIKSLFADFSLTSPIAKNKSSNGVVGAIKNASGELGLDFDFLMKTAEKESSFNPNAKAKTSSATGLFQFIDNTWLSLIKKFGEREGLGDYSSKIVDLGSGNFTADRSVKNDILKLRKDADLSSKMAAYLAIENANSMRSKPINEMSGGDLYLAHFLGASNADKLIKNINENPNQLAKDLFPAAAKANRNVFYEKGQAVTVARLYEKVTSGFSSEAAFDLSKLSRLNVANNNGEPFDLNLVSSSSSVAPNLANVAELGTNQSSPFSYDKISKTAQNLINNKSMFGAFGAMAGNSVNVQAQNSVDTSSFGVSDKFKSFKISSAKLAQSKWGHELYRG